MARCSRRLAWAALLGALTSASSSRYYAAGRPTHDSHASLRTQVPRRGLARGAPILLAAAPLLVGAQFPDIEAEIGVVDADGDGFVSRQEFVFRTRAVVESQGVSDEDLIMDGLQENVARFDEADLNADGRLDMREAEYLGYLAGVVRTRDPSVGHDALVKRVFDAVDKDQNGKIAQDELLVHLLTPRGVERLSERDHAIISDIFSTSDLDGDGGLDEHELQYASWRSERILGARSSFSQDPLNELAGAMYHFWDGDRDGILTEKELRKAAEAQASYHVRVSPLVRVALEKGVDHFAHYDADGDGRWSTQEASRFVGDLVSGREAKFLDGL